MSKNAVFSPRASIGPSNGTVEESLEKSENLSVLQQELSPEERERRTEEHNLKKREVRKILSELETLVERLEELGYDVHAQTSHKSDKRVLHHSFNLNITGSIIDPDMAPRDDMGKHIHSLDFAEQGNSISRRF